MQAEYQRIARRCEFPQCRMLLKSLSTAKIVYSNNLYDRGPIRVNTRPDEHDRFASKFLQPNFEQRSRRMAKIKAIKANSAKLIAHSKDGSSGQLSEPTKNSCV